jgi:DNA/RNA-binding domain of Phe-tRNA-synthetase-like protein
MKSGLTYTIGDEVFAGFPGYLRGVVLVWEVRNSPSPAELLSLLREAEESVRSELDLETLIDDPRIKSWREAFRSFGAKPGDYRSSIEAMARRLLRGDELPSVNALVDIGNIISLRHVLPIGSHAIDLLEANIELRLASGEEEFIPFGSENFERPQAGEIIFAEGNHVLTRRWVWRQSTRTLTQLETRAVEYNVDALLPVTLDQVGLACGEICKMVTRFCGGRMRYEILRQDNPQLKLEP